MLTPRPATLSGTIRNKLTGEPIPNLDLNLAYTKNNQPIYSQNKTLTTNAEGQYSTTFDRAIFDNIDDSSRIDITFGLNYNNESIQTGRLIQLIGLQNQAQITFDTQLILPQPLRLFGIIRDEAGTPRPDTNITFVFNSPKGPLLNQPVRSDANGQYELQYPSSIFTPMTGGDTVTVSPILSSNNPKITTSSLFADLQVADTEFNIIFEAVDKPPSPEPPTAPSPSTETSQQRMVGGQIKLANGNPFSKGVVRAFHIHEQGTIRLGEDSPDTNGQYTIQYLHPSSIEAINLKVGIFDLDGKLLNESDITSNATPLEFINLEVADSIEATNYQVQGKVTSNISAGIGNLKVQIIDKAAGQPDEILAETTTNASGEYQASFNELGLQQRGKTEPDLQAIVFKAQTRLATSEIRYNANSLEILDISIEDESASNLESEYETLTAALNRNFDGDLGSLEENDEREDITYLASKTGWDASTVALIVRAHQFSARSADSNGNSIEPAFFYALFRSGIPANEEAIYQTQAATAEKTWRNAIEQNIIPVSLGDRIPPAKAYFQTLAASRLLDMPALTGASSLKEMLSVSFDDDESRQAQFTQLYTRFEGDTAGFWTEVRNTFDEPTEQRLKIDSQLGQLTLNNAPLMRKLHREVDPQNDLTSLDRLVEQGYFHDEAWQNLISDTPIPPEIPGEDTEEKQANYSKMLASQLRISYPTAVVAEMVNSEETPLTTNTAKQEVSGFLRQQQGEFEIGMQPIEQYLARKSLRLTPEATQEIKRIQRVRQITPDDRVMNTLLSNQLDSAYAIVNRYDKGEFVQAFKESLGGERIAELTYAKSQQVHNVALNAAISYITANRAPGIGIGNQILNPSLLTAVEQANNNASDVIAYPTLENLLGEMDYCSCEHCRSILSPAAYLVDLLQFCDRPNNPKENPQDVLLRRRPDIQHLPLTCENTNTPVPYIDLVNETLEYFITNNLSLADYQGHNTDEEAKPEELLASPQFVSDAAYTTLSEASFPVALPFHSSLANLRRYFDKFEMPLAQAMEALRQNELLDRAPPSGYGWRDILMEELQLSRAESALLSDRRIPLQELYGFDAATPVTRVLATLVNAKELARRLAISYEELVAILRTQFINPNSHLIPKLERLGIPFSVLKQFKDGAITDDQFESILNPGLDIAQYGGDIKAWVKDDTNYAKIMGLIVLRNLDTEGDLCNFGNLELRYANPVESSNPQDQLAEFEYIRLIRFVRLWKKLGWTITQTDRAIAALYPANQMPNGSDNDANQVRLDAGFLTLLPRLGYIHQLMQRLNLNVKRDLDSILACFAPISTHGAGSLYHQMFLNSALIQDAVFADDGYGNFLAGNPALKLFQHREALRAAFSLTDDEFTQVTRQLGFHANTPLNLDNISNVFRHGWLARQLKLSVSELVQLIRVTGLNPFAAPDPVNPPIFRFIKFVQQLRQASLKPADALYLIWNKDINGRSGPNETEILEFARILRANFAAIDNEFALVDDPDGEIARTRMALVYGNEATDFFFGLLGDTLVTTASFSHTQATLPPALLNAAVGRLSYDNFRKELTFTGILSETVRDALKDATDVEPEFQAAVDTLYDNNQRIVNPFFGRYPELESLYETFVASELSIEQKRSDLLASFLPELQQRRKQQQVMQAISAAARVDVNFANALLNDQAVLHSSQDNTQPLIDDFVASEVHGLTAQFYFRETATGASDNTHAAESTLEYSPSHNPLPVDATAPDSKISGIWTGYLEAPENGFYNLRIDTDVDATVELTIDGQSHSLVPDGSRWSNESAIELRAGNLYAISLKAEGIKDNLTVQWETIGRGWEVISSNYLYPATSMASFRIAYIRSLKVAALANELSLSASEMAHFAAESRYQIAAQGWMNHLPVSSSLIVTNATALLQPLKALLDFVHIKAQRSPNDERLILVLKDPAAPIQKGQTIGENDPNSQSFSLLRSVTQWDISALDAVLDHLGQPRIALGQIEVFSRVDRAYQIAKQLGISVGTLIQVVTNEPTSETVRDLQSALRARYDESRWLQVLKPINDEMRQLRRDALVSYVLFQMSGDAETQHINTPEKLFEFFLMDVQMEPCMQTSRIRHALSSVQLFIERCMMNLENNVAPASFQSKQRQQWEWMKRYRVWEANRKVFLYPENWLEPELRDDQSPFFKEAMGELLQGDITEERAAGVLINYLTKLDEVAKLEPCGIEVEEPDPGTNDDVTHVVARTSGGNRKYFYRRKGGGTWSPWERINLDIEDNPVVPVVWRDRLFLFWVRILEESPQEVSENSPSNDSKKRMAEFELNDLRKKIIQSSTDMLKVRVKLILCWSEYVNGEWQETKTSAVNQAPVLGDFPPAGDNSFSFNRSDLSPVAYTGFSYSTYRNLNIGFYIDFKSSQDIQSKLVGFTLFNTHSSPRSEERKGKSADIYHSFPVLKHVEDRVQLKNGWTFGRTYKGIQYVDIKDRNYFNIDLIKGSSEFHVTSRHRHLDINWEQPFFLEDDFHVFYVTSTVEKTVRSIEPVFFGSAHPARVEAPSQIEETTAQTGLI